MAAVALFKWDNLMDYWPRPTWSGCATSKHQRRHFNFIILNLTQRSIGFFLCTHCKEADNLRSTNCISYWSTRRACNADIKCVLTLHLGLHVYSIKGKIAHTSANSKRSVSPNLFGTTPPLFEKVRHPFIFTISSPCMFLARVNLWSCLMCLQTSVKYNTSMFPPLLCSTEQIQGMVSVL